MSKLVIHLFPQLLQLIVLGVGQPEGLLQLLLHLAQLASLLGKLLLLQPQHLLLLLQLLLCRGEGSLGNLN